MSSIYYCNLVNNLEKGKIILFESFICVLLVQSNVEVKTSQYQIMFYQDRNELSKISLGNE